MHTYGTGQTTFVGKHFPSGGSPLSPFDRPAGRPETTSVDEHPAIAMASTGVSAYCHVGPRQVGNGSPPATKEGAVQGNRHRIIILRT